MEINSMYLNCKKIYSKPVLGMEHFTPQEYCAACTITGTYSPEMAADFPGYYVVSTNDLYKQGEYPAHGPTYKESNGKVGLQINEDEPFYNVSWIDEMQHESKLFYNGDHSKVYFQNWTLGYVTDNWDDKKTIGVTAIIHACQWDNGQWHFYNNYFLAKIPIKMVNAS